MNYDFNADEILQMAEQIEKNGAAFYRECAGKIEDPAAVKLLQDLAAMEDQHEKTFADIRSRLSAKEKESTTFDPDGEAVLYLKALADTKVFFEKSIDTGNLEEILKEAITAEKDSIVFYLGMKALVPEELGVVRVDAIIKEEMSHISLLSKELVALKRA
ncbi:MAG: ferritin family protein [Deltaproteobacteria bacterium]|nr:ferritin family protein [Deltaproteobacteria bacterium]